MDRPARFFYRQRVFPSIALAYAGLVLVATSEVLLLNSRVAQALIALGGVMVGGAIIHILFQRSLDQTNRLIQEALPLARSGISVELLRPYELRVSFSETASDTALLRFVLQIGSSYETVGAIGDISWEVLKNGGRCELIVSDPRGALMKETSADSSLEVQVIRRLLRAGGRIATRTTESYFGNTTLITEGDVAIVIETVANPNPSQSLVVLKAPARSELGDRYVKSFEDLWGRSSKIDPERTEGVNS